MPSQKKPVFNDFIHNPHEIERPFIHNKLFQRLSDEFHQNAFESIRKEGNKLRTYALFKSEIGLEKYLIHIKNVAIRKEMTKFRLSNHRLMIETGRHKNIAKECRFCPFCKETVETEIHFLLLCPVYESIRIKMLEPIYANNLNFTFYTNEEKFHHLLRMSQNYEICRFVSKATELRDFLNNKPKRTL